MDHQLGYGKAKRRTSRAGIVACMIGCVVFGQFHYIAHYGLPPSMSPALRWIILAPFYFLALVGLVLSVVALVGQRRLWWLAVPAFLLNGLPLCLVAFLIYQRMSR